MHFTDSLSHPSNPLRVGVVPICTKLVRGRASQITHTHTDHLNTQLNEPITASLLPIKRCTNLPCLDFVCALRLCSNVVLPRTTTVRDGDNTAIVMRRSAHHFHFFAQTEYKRRHLQSCLFIFSLTKTNHTKRRDYAKPFTQSVNANTLI